MIYLQTKFTSIHMEDKNTLSAEQSYQQGLNSFRNSDFDIGVKQFITAAKQDYLPAIKELGICYLHGISVEQNLDKAIIYFKKSKHHPESQYELCKLFFFGYGVKQDLILAKKLLVFSVKNKYIPAVNMMALCYVISKETDKAIALFNLSLSNKDRFANHLYQQQLIQNNTKGIDFINSFNWPILKNVPQKNTLNHAPEIFKVDHLLSEIECEYIKYISSPYMRPSMTVDPKTGEHVQDKIRTSYSATIDWLTEDPVINLIMQKCCINFGVNANQSEVLHVLHYSIGEEYKPHYDFFGGTGDNDNFTADQQRIKTICLYLNDVEEGGYTTFPNLDKIVEPKKGNAVFFENINPENNEPYVESLHAGEPILKGEKWLATLWIRNHQTNRGINYESI